MAFNGAGVFSRIYNWVNDKNNGIDITASRTDTEDDGFATGLSNCICRDGQSTISANIPFNSKKITGLGSATATTDACTLLQAQTNLAAFSAAGGTADAITGTYSPTVTALTNGMLLRVRAASANATTTPTFAPDGLTAHTITKSGNQALVAGDIFGSGHELLLQYNLAGTRWELLNPAVNATTFLTTASATSTYAPLASPTFTGTPALPTGTTAVTQTASNNSTKLATTAYTDTADALSLKAANNLSDLGTLATALTNLGFSTTLGSNGSITLPGGLIIKWGSPGSINSLASSSPTFGAAFPTAAYAAYVSWTAASSNAMVITALSASGLTINNNTNTNQVAYYLAIGH